MSDRPDFGHWGDSILRQGDHWYFRHDTGDRTTQENGDDCRDIQESLRRHGWEIDDPVIEHDCISGNLVPWKAEGQMSEKEQIEHLADDVDKLIQRYRTEYDMTYASVVGVLQMKSHLLCQESEEKHRQEGES